MSWDEIEHCFDKFEYLCGISGKAGNLKGQMQPGGNPFEGPRAANIPIRRCKMPYSSTLFAEAATESGPSSLPAAGRQPVAALCQSAGRRDGRMHLLRLLRAFRLRQLFQVQRRRPRILPVLMKKQNFEVRTECEVLKINLHPDGKTAKSVTYVDTAGSEFEQPGD